MAVRAAMIRAAGKLAVRPCHRRTVANSSAYSIEVARSASPGMNLKGNTRDSQTPSARFRLPHLRETLIANQPSEAASIPTAATSGSRSSGQIISAVESRLGALIIIAAPCAGDPPMDLGIPSPIMVTWQRTAGSKTSRSHAPAGSAMEGRKTTAARVSTKGPRSQPPSECADSVSPPAGPEPRLDRT
jgi:hypothetical protein